MDLILCKKCDTGNPGYLSVCAGCGADLFAADNIDEGPPKGSEISDEKLRRNAIIAVVVSVFTTIFKVWLLYPPERGPNSSFLQFRIMLIVFWPFITAAAVAAKYRRWYLPLMFDSAIMIVAFIIFMVILIAAKLKGF